MTTTLAAMLVAVVGVVGAWITHAAPATTLRHVVATALLCVGLLIAAQTVCGRNLVGESPRVGGGSRRARELASRVASGPPALRRGATRVYAHNLGGERVTYCAGALSGFLDDDQVRRFAADAFHHTSSPRSPDLRRFVEVFAASRALRAGSRAFSEYLLQFGPGDPHWALSVLQAVLVNAHDEEPYSFAGGNLVRLVLRLYTDPTADQDLRMRAMDVFDGMMERYTYEAQSALEEWDRR